MVGYVDSVDPPEGKDETEKPGAVGCDACETYGPGEADLAKAKMVLERDVSGVDDGQ